MSNRIIKCGEDVVEIFEIGKTKRIAMVHGVFDVLHCGHMSLFDFAKQYADYVIVSLVSDKFVEKGIGRPIYTEQERAYMLASLRNVDKVILTIDYYPFVMITTYLPHVWIHGGRNKPAPEHELLSELHIPIIVFEQHSFKISTTAVVKRIRG